MLTEPELKRRVGLILGLEEHGDRADWFAIASLSAELLRELPPATPMVVKAYLTDSDIRRADVRFARDQQLQLINYLRSSA